MDPKKAIKIINIQKIYLKIQVLIIQTLYLYLEREKKNTRLLLGLEEIVENEKYFSRPMQAYCGRWKKNSLGMIFDIEMGLFS